MREVVMRITAAALTSLLFSSVAAGQGRPDGVSVVGQNLYVYLSSRTAMSRDLPVVVICAGSPGLGALGAPEKSLLSKRTGLRIVDLDACSNLDDIRQQTDHAPWLVLIRDLTEEGGRVVITAVGVSPASTWQEEARFDPSARPAFVLLLSNFAT